jgi:hypothetical protein
MICAVVGLALTEGSMQAVNEYDQDASTRAIKGRGWRGAGKQWTCRQHTLSVAQEVARQAGCPHKAAREIGAAMEQTPWRLRFRN